MSLHQEGSDAVCCNNYSRLSISLPKVLIS